MKTRVTMFVMILALSGVVWWQQIRIEREEARVRALQEDMVELQTMVDQLPYLIRTELATHRRAMIAYLEEMPR